MNPILVIAEQRDGTPRKVSHEITTAARTLADGLGAEVHVLVLGAPSAAASDLGRYSADRVWAAEGAALRGYAPEAYCDVVAGFIKEREYFAVLFAATAQGKDLAPRVAARLDLPLATEATALAIEDGELRITRPVYAGKAFAQVTLDGAPRLVSLRASVFLPQERARAGAVEALAVSVDPARGRVRVRELVAAAGAKLDVSEAPILVSGGRGMRGPENWHLLEQLCDAIGPQCTLGASRAVVDAGWRPHAEQVGQTGKTVSPQLYIAVGISGAIQHLAGMRTARTIVAINKDPDAPIFKVADYGVVGDAFEILPRLAEEFRKLRAAH